MNSMTLKFRPFELALTHTWTIARSLESTARGRGNAARIVLVQLLDQDGIVGYGEGAPSSRYQENLESCLAFLGKVDATQLSFLDVAASMTYLEKIAPGNHVPKAALNIALMDGAAKRARMPIYDFLKLGFTEGKHITSFSIGIDSPEMIHKKVLEAADYPILKLKVGGPDDKANLGALRAAAPEKRVRVDANEGWKTKETALRNIEWLAADKHIEFIEQPMPADSDPKDLAWLKERSPLALMADEGYLSANDIGRCADLYHAVNVKLVKTGGISAGYDALRAARQAGLKTMLGCMIESSILISAAAQLAELTDYLDIDGNLLINNDPYTGPTARNGVISFASAREPYGLRVTERCLAPGQE